MLQKGQASDNIKSNKGWFRGIDNRIISSRPGLYCPDCGLLLCKLLPETEARGLVVFCRKCKQERIVNISSTSVP